MKYLPMVVTVSLFAAAVMVSLAGTACDQCSGTGIHVLDAEGVSKLDTCAEWAGSEEERKQGLSGRAVLAPGDGLWMEFPTVGEVCITGEGMQFPIDVIFVDDASKVVAKRSLGAGDKNQICEQGVQNVLEVNAGEAKYVGPGDTVQIDYVGL